MPSESEKGVIKPLAPAAIPLIAWRLRDLARTARQGGDRGYPHLRQLPFFLRRRQNPGHGPRRATERQGPVCHQPRCSRARPFETKTSSPGNPFATSLPARCASASCRPLARRALRRDHRGGGPGPEPQLLRGQFQGLSLSAGVLSDARDSGWLRPDHRAARNPCRAPTDPRYVQTNAVWSPDGKYLVFARAEGKDAYPEGAKVAEYANDPNETAMQYDLYRIPFNEGRGGQAGTDRGSLAERHEQHLSQSFARRPLDRLRAGAQRPVDASRQPALHRAGGRRAARRLRAIHR